MSHSKSSAFRIGLAAASLIVFAAIAASAWTQTTDPASLVNPIIGTANGGNDYPGATMPLGMLNWSPEEPFIHPRPKVKGVPGSMRDGRGRPAAPGGYAYAASRISGFSLTHLMGTGCAGASGDIPFMPYVGTVTSSPADDPSADLYGSTFSHADETAAADYYKVVLANGVTVELAATDRTGSGLFTYLVGKPAVMFVRTAYSEVGSSDAHISIDAATRTISGLRSTASTLPAGPIICAAFSATEPVPVPRSSTASPGRNSARAITWSWAGAKRGSSSLW